MQQIISFFIRNKNFLLFAVLFLVSVSLTIRSHNYHKGKFVTSANFLAGGIFGFKTTITDYFDLEKQNEMLTEENRQLRLQLANQEEEAVWNMGTDSLYKILPNQFLCPCIECKLLQWHQQHVRRTTQQTGCWRRVNASQSKDVTNS